MSSIDLDAIEALAADTTRLAKDAGWPINGDPEADGANFCLEELLAQQVPVLAAALVALVPELRSYRAAEATKAAQYDAIMALVENPTKPTHALVALMRDYKPTDKLAEAEREIARLRLLIPYCACGVPATYCEQSQDGDAEYCTECKDKWLANWAEYGRTCGSDGEPMVTFIAVDERARRRAQMRAEFGKHE